MQLFLVITLGGLSLCNALYTLERDYGTNMSFFEHFEFYVSEDEADGPDPTHGVVNYVDSDDAIALGLISAQNNQIYMGVQWNNTLTGSDNRSAVRIEGLDEYTHGLFISDVAHMPGGICGTWPAWWLFGDDNPAPDPANATGEIDIIENVNSAINNTSTLWAYKDGTCSTTNYGSDQMTGKLQVNDSSITSLSCHGTSSGTGPAVGCEIDDTRTDSFGTTFNSEGGGVYALEWTSDLIRVFFFPRASIPTDDSGPLAGSPDPNMWGEPAALFGGGCDLDSYFRRLKMIFNITFCGDAAAGDKEKGDGEENWKKDPVCSVKATTCEAYVRGFPADFKDAYWLLNSVRVYQQS